MAAHLPQELLRMICSYLPDSASVLSFRRTCHNFANAGLPHLLPHVNVVLLPSSVARLQAISQNPILRGYVRSIAFNGDRVSRYPNSEVYEIRRASWQCFLQRFGAGQLRQPDMSSGGSDRSTSDTCDQTKQHYEQRRLRRCNRYVEEIAVAVSRLRNMHTLILSTFSDRFHPPMWVPKEASKYIFDFCHPEYERNSSRLLRAALLGASRRSLRLKCLVAPKMPMRFFTDVDYFPHFQSLFTGLQNVSLHIPGDHTFWKGVECHRLLRFFGSLRNLETIRVALLSESKPSPKDLINCADLFKARTYPHLRALCLENVKIDAGSLIDFFVRHAATLKSVHLKGIILAEDCQFGGSWHAVFETMSRGH